MDELFKWLLAFVFSVYLLLFVFSNDPVPEALAHHWTHDCRLLEKNIDKGLLSPTQNRLQCGDVIENVSKADYDRAISGDKQTTLAEAMKEIFTR
ncbi:hypothetical protein ACY4XG_004518 [Klebsiella pneumoniae]|uniref:hypothetical protein n=1 Tax=Klebsiella pneumoniae complex TaxID=3390273 RepID=UPI000BA226FD|nr:MULTISPECIES: hypothetical protein [Klebsiella]ASV23398.1 hypothetical protein B8P98_29715 [Klebsiella quasivariicola]MBD7850676.1 hypothetical protein [Klebsiella pneumoniae]MDU2910886.1 hypothetical protein [Klebsiella pneumoniae]PXI32435.1 hypothetical protein DMP66_23180 [Klebsiella pneumoniae]RRE93824.1 hypothetical protein EAO05_00285 [Klebsiella pneumoniae]